MNTYLASKPRYEILDGLRGVAAMLVVAYHLFETYYHGGPDQPVNHGYLAVDFFFVLSGFVIGYAYDDRWDKMTTWDFFKRRLIRLTGKGASRGNSIGKTTVQRERTSPGHRSRRSPFFLQSPYRQPMVHPPAGADAHIPQAPATGAGLRVPACHSEARFLWHRPGNNRLQQCHRLSSS